MSPILQELHQPVLLLFLFPPCIYWPPCGNADCPVPQRQLNEQPSCCMIQSDHSVPTKTINQKTLTHLLLSPSPLLLSRKLPSSLSHWTCFDTSLALPRASKIKHTSLQNAGTPYLCQLRQRFREYWANRHLRRCHNLGNLLCFHGPLLFLSHIGTHIPMQSIYKQFHVIEFGNDFFKRLKQRMNETLEQSRW